MQNYFLSKKLENLTISIVVPVYNVENYLERCVESLVHQTYKKIEIILVNDGSTDNSFEVCKALSKLDPRIKVFNQPNKGLSGARNRGIAESKGEYLIFVDSDDYISYKSCFELVSLTNTDSPDIIAGCANVIVGGIKQAEMIHSRNIGHTSISGQSFLKNELQEKTFNIPAWLNMYRRNFLLDENLFFKEGFLHEDVDFTPRAFLKAKKVRALDFLFYNYVIRPNSIATHKNSRQNGIDILKICENLIIIYDALEDLELKKLLKDRLASTYLSGFQKGKLYKRKDKHLLNKKLVYFCSKSLRNRIKSTIFAISPFLYYWINRITKHAKLT